MSWVLSEKRVVGRVGGYSETRTAGGVVRRLVTLLLVLLSVLLLGLLVSGVLFPRTRVPDVLRLLLCGVVAPAVVEGFVGSVDVVVVMVAVTAAAAVAVTATATVVVAVVVAAAVAAAVAVPVMVAVSASAAVVPIDVSIWGFGRTAARPVFVILLCVGRSPLLPTGRRSRILWVCGLGVSGF